MGKQENYIEKALNRSVSYLGLAIDLAVHAINNEN